MALSDRLREAAAALLGVSAYQPAGKGYGPQIDDAVVEATREALGGNLQPLPTTKLRWYLADLEVAQAAADAGDIRMAARLWRAMRRDGVLTGLMATRTAGVIRLPKRFYGNAEVASLLRSRNGSRSIFDEMFPPSELSLLAGDGIMLGIGVAELVPVEGRSYPVMVRLQPEFLTYRWAENRWYFNSIAGAIPIVPGDGRWILHVPGGRLTPWEAAAWPACGRSFINKEHAMLHRSNYSGKLANPARVAYAPSGATEAQRVGFFRRLMAWATNTAFDLPPGWDVKILESNGRGWEVFQREIDTSDNEYKIALAGQTVTTDGGSGFANAEVPADAKRDLIQDTADQLSYTINTQGIPQFVVSHWGVEALQTPTVFEWDTKRPIDHDRESRVLGQLGAAIGTLNAALAPAEKQVDTGELCIRFAVPTIDGAIAANEDVKRATGDQPVDNAAE